MGYGPIVNGKQTAITPWHGSWAQTEFAKRCAPPKFDSATGKWVVYHPEKPELIVAIGNDAQTLRWSLPVCCEFNGSIRY